MLPSVFIAVYSRLMVAMGIQHFCKPVSETGNMLVVGKALWPVMHLHMHIKHACSSWSSSSSI